MCKFTVKCPICGHENKGLYLEETNGWFVCDKCKHEVGLPQFMTKVPFYKDNTKKAVLAAKL